MAKMERSGLGPVGIGAAAYDAYKNAAQLLYVRRDRNPDSGRIKLVDKDMHVRTGPVVAGALKTKAFLPERYDVLVLPAREMVEKLREWTAPKAVEQFERQNRAIIALFDDYIHDSRAWFRMPYFHEYSPGGYGWARVFFVGNDNAVRHLGLAEDARAAEQAERIKALVRRINAGPTPTLDEMLMGD